MTDHTQLRKLATDALLDHEIRHSFTIDHSGWSGASDLIEAQEFIAKANPQAVIELLDEIEQLKKDAERYRWLRGPDFESTRYSRWKVEYWAGQNGWAPMQREQMDAAIDAAISKKRKALR